MNNQLSTTKERTVSEYNRAMSELKILGLGDLLRKRTQAYSLFYRKSNPVNSVYYDEMAAYIINEKGLIINKHQADNDQV